MTLEEFLKLPGAKVHDGSGCPVPLDSKPGVLIMGFEHPHDATGDFARDYVWTHGTEIGHAARIIAYREAP